jgi:Flp pilus assembly pilin Flp
MKRMTDVTKRFLKDESGIAVTEYGLLVALIAVALVVVVKAFGTDLAAWFKKSTGTITTATP